MSSPTQRIAKAWRVRVRGYDDTDIVYAENGAKARYLALIDVRDFDRGVQFKDIRALREEAADRVLPGEHWIVAELSSEDRRIIEQAFGSYNRRDPGYRDHYCTAAGDTRLLRLAWEFGLFRGPYGERDHGETPGWSGAFFYLTDFGKHVARSMLPLYR